MRLLTYNINEEIIDYLDKNNLYIIDIAEDIEDAIYHSSVRYYNMIVVKFNNYYDCMQILKNINCRFTAVIFISKSPDKKFQLKLLKSGAMDILELLFQIHIY